jgi:hypothetical protein
MIRSLLLKGAQSSFWWSFWTNSNVQELLEELLLRSSHKSLTSLCEVFRQRGYNQKRTSLNNPTGEFTRVPLPTSCWTFDKPSRVISLSRVFAIVHAINCDVSILKRRSFNFHGCSDNEAKWRPHLSGGPWKVYAWPRSTIWDFPHQNKTWRLVRRNSSSHRSSLTGLDLYIVVGIGEGRVVSLGLVADYSLKFW